MKINLIPQIRQALNAQQLELCGQLLHQAFRSQVLSPELVHLSALWHFQSGRTQQAINVLKALLYQHKGLPHALWNDLGVLYTEQGQNHLAEKSFQQALLQQPNTIDYLQNYGQALLAQKQFEPALKVFQTLQQHHSTPENLLFITRCLLGLQRLSQAEETLSAWPNKTTPEYLVAQTHFLQSKTSTQQALRYLENTIQSIQDVPENLMTRHAELLFEAERYPEALERFTALHQHNHQPDILCTLGTLYKKLAQPEQAIKHWKQFLSRQPLHAETLYNLGNTYTETDQYADAVDCYQQAVASQPSFLEAWINLTLAHYERREFPLAEQAAEKAVRLDPENARAHIGYGDALLMQKKYDAGFQEIEWRFAEKNYTLFKYPAPPWTGQDLAQKHLLIMSEQGLGDIIMFSRFIFNVQQRFPTAKISLRCRPELVALFAHWPFDIYPDGTLIEEADYAVALMSLLKILKVNPEQLAPPTHLAHDYKLPARVKISSHAENKALNIGFVWKSGQGLTQHKRSMPASLLAGLIQKFPQHRFYALQKEELTPAVFKSLPNYQSLSVHLRNFTDTAACCQQLDLILSVDTSVAHLAGSL